MLLIRAVLLRPRRVGLREFSTSRLAARQADFTHAVIGAGVVGLAIAQRLAATHPKSSVLLLERHMSPGTETSSRNSEVLHAGIYYGRTCLKAQLCVRGRQLAYDFCARYGVGHARVGKWIVAQTPEQYAALTGIASTADVLGVPTRWISADVARAAEPLVRAAAGVLESPETGIVDSHGLMVALLGQFEDAGGVLARGACVEGIEAENGGMGGWTLQVRDAATGDVAEVVAESIVNAAGLGAVMVNNLIVAPERRRKMFYAKGNYFAYAGPQPRIRRLIYPAPTPGGGGLGTHLTLDLAGRVRFGPDVEWVDRLDDMAVNSARLPEAITAIKQYLPGIGDNLLVPDYAGVRPKLARAGAVGEGKGFQDFIIQKEEGYTGWVNLLGIESPGLTSSLAIAEMVEGLLYK
ncbi:hypothetical protein Cpir12675_003024 [Ceratocystis pirilliformis]|uniref:L-2-hydroxyglutarate dehydrogenase, mitochondrial n=1 Tax=Ceratocystis pirilliformis TaxID=259994 RepID=A0ABR3Z8Z1_9PEZI